MEELKFNYPVKKLILDGSIYAPSINGSTIRFITQASKDPIATIDGISFYNEQQRQLAKEYGIHHEAYFDLVDLARSDQPPVHRLCVMVENVEDTLVFRGLYYGLPNGGKSRLYENQGSDVILPSDVEAGITLPETLYLDAENEYAEIDVYDSLSMDYVTDVHIHFSHLNDMLMDVLYNVRGVQSDFIDEIKQGNASYEIHDYRIPDFSRAAVGTVASKGVDGKVLFVPLHDARIPEPNPSWSGWLLGVDENGDYVFVKAAEKPDAELSILSENAVQNKVVTLELGKKMEGLTINGQSVVHNNVATLTLGPQLKLENDTISVEYSPLKIIDDDAGMDPVPSGCFAFQKLAE